MSESHRHQHTRQVVNRLSRAEGHVAAVKRMVEERASCSEVLLQIAAVRAALDQVARIVLNDHLDSCLRGSAEGEEADAAWDEFKKALDRYVG